MKASYIKQNFNFEKLQELKGLSEKLKPVATLSYGLN
jgi:hypothetical protein